MTIGHLVFDWAINPETDRPWVRHTCNGVVLVYELPQTTTGWRQVGDRLEPSFHCTDCGAHTFMLDCDRVEWSALPAEPPEPEGTPTDQSALRTPEPGRIDDADG